MPKKLQKRADGRYVRVLIDPVTHKRTSIYGRSEKEIDRKIRERTEKEEVGEKFKEIANAWWDDIEPRLAIQSIRPYRPALRRAIEEFGDVPIKLIRPSDISAYFRNLAKSELAHKTVSNYKTVVSQIFDYAVSYGYADINPAKLVKLPPDLSKTKRSAASSVDESIIKAAADDEFLLPYIALMSGMRKGEILALQWKDIDFEKNTIDISKSVCHESNVPIVKSPKTESSVRRVPLLIPLKERLLQIKKRPSNKYIISLDGGKTPLSETQYQRQMELYKERTGITCSAHMLRHSFATIAFEAGVPAKSVQEILGHRQLSTTMDIYTEFRNKAYDEAAEKLNSIYKKNNN